MAELKFADLGFPKDIETKELKVRLRRAQQNQIQLESWMDLVIEEIIKRGG